jgi:hypothetical protein
MATSKIIVKNYSNSTLAIIDAGEGNGWTIERIGHSVKFEAYYKFVVIERERVDYTSVADAIRGFIDALEVAKKS